MRSRGASARIAALAAALLASPAVARAEGLSLYLEPSIAMSSQDSRDQLGNTTHLEQRALSQLYRIAFDRPIGPALGFSTGVQLEKLDAQSDGSGGTATTASATRRSLFGRLTLDLPALSGGLSFDLGDRASPQALTLVNENLAGYLSWRPLDLPEVNLRLSRTHFYDTGHDFQDTTTNSALLAARFTVQALELKYLLQWTRPDDAITGTESSAISQAAQATYGDRFFEGRTSVYASLTLHNQMVTTLSTGTGTITTQQHPAAGLSLIEQFPAQPSTVTLLPNPPLVDGNLAVAAALDLGYALSLAGDQNDRDMGVQFSDLLTSVNRLQVWVDKKLAPEVAAAFTWSAWQSGDNRTWTPVSITGPVTFGAFENRFEIPIPETRARYLKVVTRPLQGGVTTDPAFAAIQVTELQAYFVTSAAAVPRQQASSGAQLNASASTLLWRAPNLTWDLMLTLERRISPNATLWSVLNGLSASQRVARNLSLSERVSRFDGDYGIGRVGQTDWSAGLTWTPLPTFLGSLSYSGMFADAVPTFDAGSGSYYESIGNFSNTLSMLARADLYPGIGTQLSASAGLTSTPAGIDTVTETVTASASLTPNPWTSFNFAVLSGWSTSYEYRVLSASSRSLRLDSSLNFRPTEALSASASVSRVIAGTTPTTLGSVGLNYAPFRGDLQFTLSYSKNYDTTMRAMTELVTPGLRWTIRPGVLLTATYTFLDASTPVSLTQTQAFNLVLRIAL